MGDHGHTHAHGHTHGLVDPSIFLNPQKLSHLWWLAAAGAIGFVGNELAARLRLLAGRITSQAWHTVRG
jgi:hypothetical protein